MKRNLLVAVAFFATLSANAQSIAAVSPSNVTTMYQTLDKAVTEADPGSIIYLPGGGFNISDDTKIEKRLTIMGISHRGDTDNADGATVIAGSLNFEKGSSGSSVIGAFISGNINVGTEEDEVTNLTVRFCNVNSIQVKNAASSGMIVSQCYLRNTSKFLGCNATLENNIIHSICDVNGGSIKYNVIVSSGEYRRGEYGFSGRYDIYGAAIVAYNSTINYNVICYGGTLLQGSGCLIYNNMTTQDWGDNPVTLSNVEWNDVFSKYNNGVITPASNFHFQGDYVQYEGIIGIYGGSSFKDDKSLAPIPRIVSKKVNEHTDSSGNLHIEISVKAE